MSVKRMPFLQELEPRVLFDGGLGIMIDADIGSSQTGTTIQEALQNTASHVKEVVIVDSALNLPTTHLPSIFQVVTDGIRKISSILKSYTGLEAIHIVSHGASGEMVMGEDHLNAQTVNNFQSEIASWGRSLKVDGGLLLYGCNIAKGEQGLNLLQVISGITKADVAAADHEVGDVGDADWNLNVKVSQHDGAGENHHLFDPAIAGWHGTFGMPTIGLQTASDNVGENGSLSFSAGNSNAISVTDPGAGAVSVNLSVAHGSLKLNTTTGLTFKQNTASQVTFNGSLSSINTALNTLVYNPTPFYVGADSLAIQVNDGPNQANDSVAITVAANVSALFTFGGSGGYRASALDADTILLNNGAAFNQLATASAVAKLDLSQDAEIHYSVNPNVDDLVTAADGVVFVLHNDPLGVHAVGGAGGGIGATGIQNAIAIPYDTYQNTDLSEPSAGLTTIYIPSSAAQFSGVRSYNLHDMGLQLGGPNYIGNNSNILAPVINLAEGQATDLKHNAFHAVKLIWDSSTYTLSHYYENIKIHEIVLGANFANAYFGGSSSVFMLFTAATGGEVETSCVRIDSLPTLIYPPINSVPGVVTLDAGSHSIVVANVAASAVANLTVDLSVSHGSLNLRNVGGLVVTGNSTNNVHVTGSVTNISSAIQTLDYTPNTPYSGSDTLTIISTDATNNLASTSTMPIVVTPVPPVNTMAGGITLQNGSSLTFGVGAVADVSVANLTVELMVGSGNLNLSSFTGLTATGNGTNKITLIGGTANINSAISAITYTTSAMLGSDTLTLTTKDVTNNLTTITTLAIKINLILPQTPATNNVSKDVIAAVKVAAAIHTESSIIVTEVATVPNKESDAPQKQANTANSAVQPLSNTVVNTNVAKPKAVSKPVINISNSTFSSSSASSIDNGTLSQNIDTNNNANSIGTSIGTTNQGPTATKIATKTATENTTNQNFNDLVSKDPPNDKIVTDTVKKMSAVVVNSKN